MSSPHPPFGHHFPLTRKKATDATATLGTGAPKRRVRGFGLTLLVASTPLFAQVVAPTPHGIVVAHDRVIDLFNRGGERLWTTAGLQTPEAIVSSKEQIAVLDPLANEARIVELATGRGRTVRTGETPMSGVFIGSALYLLERDARALERIGADGTRASISIAADPAFLRERGGTLYVYSRAQGIVQEIAVAPFAIRRTAKTAAFGSAFEVDGRNAYVVQPRAGKIAIVALTSMTASGTIDAGAVPVDIDFTSGGTALTARTLAIADPAMKKVWLIEGAQSTGQAFFRGFFRGLLGLGLFGGRESQFPTGVDRVFTRGTRWYAYDSSSGTLYRFTRGKSATVVKSVAPQRFAVTDDGVFIWNDAVRRLQRVSSDG